VDVAAAGEDASVRCEFANLTAKSSSGNQNPQAVRFHSYSASTSMSYKYAAGAIRGTPLQSQAACV
jgi:hypothetical protein